jgi:hypothetical protein
MENKNSKQTIQIQNNSIQIFGSNSNQIGIQ